MAQAGRHPDDHDVEAMRTNRRAVVPATDGTDFSSRGPSAVADGVYCVLATLQARSREYRVLAELHVDDGSAHLRIFRFCSAGQNEWLAERKISLAIANPEIRPLTQKISGAEHVLARPVQLDDSWIATIFGPSGPPEK